MLPEKNMRLDLKCKGKNAGSIKFNTFEMDMFPSFNKYLNEGWEMQVSIAIDFTLSNREINDCRSLHRLNTNGEMNHYERVIFEVCNVLTPLVKGRPFNAYGFGGIPTYCGATKVSKLWNLNGDPDDAGVDGTVGVLAAYTKAQKQTKLAGPSYFANLLQRIEKEIVEDIHDAGGVEKNRLYNLVIIVTDGFCNDMKETTQ